MTNGTFLLADIGGYTTFLSEVGIEHAKEITSHLLNGIPAHEYALLTAPMADVAKASGLSAT